MVPSATVAFREDLSSTVPSVTSLSGLEYLALLGVDPAELKLMLILILLPPQLHQLLLLVICDHASVLPLLQEEQAIICRIPDVVWVFLVQRRLAFVLALDNYWIYLTVLIIFVVLHVVFL